MLGNCASAAAPTVFADGRQASRGKSDCLVTSESSFIYGIDDKGVVWETDMTCNTSTQVLDGQRLLGTGKPAFFNGMGLNASNTEGDAMYWLNSEGALLAWIRVSGAYGVVATPSQLQSKASGNPANGAWYLDSYWFVETAKPPASASEATIYRVFLNPPSKFGALPAFDSLSSYTINLGSSVRVGFGDIVFADGPGDGGVLYLAVASVDGIPDSPTAPMYVVNDVTAMIESGSTTANRIRGTGVGTKQLAFDRTGTLWAHDHNTCQWSTVDTSNGAVTNVFEGPACLRDIGGSAAPCECSPADNSYIYGIADDTLLYEIDVTSNTTKAIFDLSPYIGNRTRNPNINCFAYDREAGGLFFFMNREGAILVWERASSVVGTLAPPSAVATYGNPANAAYYKSAYWFVVTENPPVEATSAIISRVAYTQPTTFGGLPVLTNVTNYTIDFQTANGSPFTIKNGYGDIAFASKDGGSLYLAMLPLTTGETAALMVVTNVDGAIASGEPWVAKPVLETGLPSLQISFDCSDSELWATNYITREWGTLSLTDGTLTPVFTGAAIPGYSTGFRDIGGASCTAAKTCPCLSAGENVARQSRR